MSPIGNLFFSPILGIAELKSHDPGGGVHLIEPSSALFKRFFLGCLLLLVALLLVAASRRLRRGQYRVAQDKRRIDDFLASRNFTESELALLEDIVRSSGESRDRVTRLVLSFDRGVDQYLEERPEMSGEDRLHRLRRLKSLRAKLSLDRVAPCVPLLSTRELVPGQELLCRALPSDRGEVLLGTLRDLDDSGLFVEFPEVAESRGKLVDPTAKKLEVYFLRRSDGGYRFCTRILSEATPSAAEAGQVIWLLAHPRKLSREQRRNFFRIPVHENLRFAFIPHSLGGSVYHAPGLNSITLEREGRIVDLSGGGCRVVAEGAPVRPEDAIVLRLPFLEEPFNLDVLVARCAKIYRTNAEFGFNFENLSDQVQSAIVRHVETVHRRLRARVVERV